MTLKGLLAIGKIQKVHGVKGELKVLFYSGSAEILNSINEVFLGKDGDRVEPFTIRRFRGSKKTSIIEFEGMDPRSARERVGQTVWIRREMLPVLGEDEYYWVDLIGMEVYLTDGRHVGTIEGIMNFGSVDIYSCKKGKKEILIPAIKGVIKRIDLDRKRMIVEEVEGLV